MFDRFTEAARHVLVLAEEEARLADFERVGSEHVLLGLIREGEGVAAQALQSLGVSEEAVRVELEEMLGYVGPPIAGRPPFTPRAMKALELSFREALELGHDWIGTAHLLLGLVREGEDVAADALVASTGSLATVRQRVEEALAGAAGTAGHDRPPQPY